MNGSRPSTTGGLGVSRSAPTLAAAFNLRQYSEGRKRIAPERPASTGKLIPLEEIDVIGGNGRWRQRKAKVEFERRAIEEAEEKRQQKLLEAERVRRKAMIEKKRKQQAEEEEKRRREERDRQRRDAEEKERKRNEAEEKKRLERELAEQEWLRRQPKTCEVCNGCTKCKKCFGVGYTFSMFLVGKVDRDTLFENGRLMEGCEECGGYKQNLLADLKPGSGKCANCLGVGKVTPVIEPMSPASRKRVAHLASFQGGGDSSPKSPSAPAIGFGDVAGARPGRA